MPISRDDPPHECSGSRRLGCSTADLEVFGGLLAPIAGNFVLNDLPLVESAQAGTLDRGNVDEHVLAAALRLNESVALGRVEPLHGSGSHLGLLALCASMNRSRLDRAMRQVRVLGDDLRAAQNGSLARQTENLEPAIVRMTRGRVNDALSA